MVKEGKTSSSFIAQASKIPKWDSINSSSRCEETARYNYENADTLGSKIPRMNSLKETLH